ncbi:hypothetical protein Sru01_05130 [Sphaerisporangium rufum]|uniref:YbaB/EbfC family DNA-binding protein n=2 Tax=Sphaerisporangium rufum TaxID=1381558 RepID=A0A919QWR7_9ACTN|nr:hypothetical protein Sru01_05130 [Sphaerisporangium rufum]
MAERAAALQAWLARGQEELDRITGRADSESGAVTVTVAGDGKVTDVTFRPRALRLDSEALATEVLATVQEAQRDAARRADELMRDAVDGFDPAGARDELHRMLSHWR